MQNHQKPPKFTTGGGGGLDEEALSNIPHFFYQYYVTLNEG
jgi:hypothetical protein